MKMEPTAREQRELQTLRQRRTREETGRFLAEGVRVVEDLAASALRVHWVLAASSLEDSERGAALLAALEARGVPLRRVEERDFARLAATDTPQGVLAVAEQPVHALPGLLGARTLLVLDAVQDPGNFGTLVRTAEALGVEGVIALPGTVDPWNPKAVRAAVGSSFRVPIAAARWEEARPALAAAGFQVLVADVGGEPVRRPERAALVVGNEGAGVSPEVLQSADRVVGVPLPDRAESLNVAAAAAILLYELTR
jgi:RNA methyltransferase, TrmH family